MGFEKIERLLKQRIGLTSESVGFSSIVRAARQRMRACDITDAERYYRQVSSSSDEMMRLTEEAIVPETWFFRDYQPFLSIQEYVKKGVWGNVGPLKILSLPCSSGEEPYSIAMVLLQAGLQPGRFIIDAIDISFKNLEHARKAVYGRNSFRGDRLDFRDAFFQAQGDAYVLRDTVRACVRFNQGNLLDAIFRPIEADYHLIFCRNLLIYFDRPTQASAVKKFHTLLAEKGLFFVGHAEMGAVDNQLFTPTRYAKAFAFSKRKNALDEKVKSFESAKFKKNTLKPSYDRRKTTFIEPLIERRREAASAPSEPPQTCNTQNTLRQAESLANLGQLAEAAQMCEQYIQKQKQDAGGYFLMGIIREEVGNKDEAMVQFKRATYLDPSHHDALLHLASLSRQKGDAQGARAYRQRAERVKARSTLGSEND